MKFGFDLHGVIDSRPELFSAMTTALLLAGHEVHILTGPPDTPELRQQLEAMGISWSRIFSIADYLKSQQAEGKLVKPMWQDNSGNWWSDPYDWDRAKGDYAFKAGLDIHFDDSDQYSYFFLTPYCRFYSRDTHRIQKTKVPNGTDLAGQY